MTFLFKYIVAFILKMKFSKCLLSSLEDKQNLRLEVSLGYSVIFKDKASQFLTFIIQTEFLLE